MLKENGHWLPVPIVKEVKALGVEAYHIAAELSDPAEVQHMIDEIKSKGTPVDILFNDALLCIHSSDDRKGIRAGDKYYKRHP